MTLRKVTKGFGYISKAFLGNSEKARYEARHDFLSALAVRWGLRMYNRNLSWHTDPEFISEWKKYPDRQTDIVHERKFNLFKIAKNLKDVPGDIAECGVFKGSSAFLMLAASRGANKHYYGFDSFEGLSEPTEDDAVLAEKTFKWKKHDLSVSENYADKNLQVFKGHYTLLKGWIPSRFDEVSDKKFSLVHIDVDLFDPTLDTLKFFWPRMNSGGMVVCDDYGFDSCPGATKAMDDFGKIIGQSVVHLTTGQGFLVKR